MAKKKTKKRTQQPPLPTVDRRIFFYRLNCGTEDSGEPVSFDPTEPLLQIKRLPWELPGRYIRTIDGGLMCCWVDRTKANQRLRLATIRRAGLPQVENGDGILSGLPIPPSSGLAEITHMMFFPNNLIGAVFNFYGPRPTSLGGYFKAKVPSMPPLLSIDALIRQNISDQIDKFVTLRMLDLKIRPSYAQTIERADENLGAAFSSNIEAVSGDVQDVELILRAGRKKDSNLGERLINAVKRIVGKEDLRENVKRFIVSGLVSETQRVLYLDLLNDKLVKKKTIVRQSQRTRALVDSSAYEAIEQAYEELRNELVASSTLEVQNVYTTEKTSRSLLG